MIVAAATLGARRPWRRAPSFGAAGARRRQPLGLAALLRARWKGPLAGEGSQHPRLGAGLDHGDELGVTGVTCQLAGLVERGIEAPGCCHRARAVCTSR